MALKSSIGNLQRIIPSNKRPKKCRQRNEEHEHEQQKQKQQQLTRQQRRSHHYFNITTATVTALAIAAAVLNLVSYVTAFTTTSYQQQHKQQNYHDRIQHAPYYRPSSISYSSSHTSTTTLTSAKTFTILPTFATTLKSKTRLFLAPRPAGTGDQAEWKALLMALQLYKAAYGDLKVPVRFVVPSMAPWPGMYTITCDV